MITNAFTCTGPYAILIMLGIKRVENRSMCPSPVKGRCAVSCSLTDMMKKLGKAIGIELLDHLIIGNQITNY